MTEKEIIEELTAVLQPFAEAYKPPVTPITDNPKYLKFLDQNTVTPKVTMGDFRRAHELLNLLATIQPEQRIPRAFEFGAFEHRSVVLAQDASEEDRILGTPLYP